MSTPETRDDQPLPFDDWGLIPYDEALERQLRLVEDIAETGRPGTLVMCTHPPVVTLGRATQPGDVFDWSGPTIEISRGGRATYHGPSQLVAYPIVNLKVPRRGRAPQEIAGYLRDLENAVIHWLESLGIRAEGRSLRKKSFSEGATEETGVWVGDRKVASLGIGVRKWISYHGVAVNLDHDPSAFVGLNPCGFRREVMVSVEELLGQRLDRDQAANELRERLLSEI